MLDSVIKVNKRYYPQTLLEECKYEIIIIIIIIKKGKSHQWWFRLKFI